MPAEIGQSSVPLIGAHRRVCGLLAYLAAQARRGRCRPAGTVCGRARDDNPDDADGWIKLMRSRLVLGERDAALNALRRANEAFADVPETRARIAAAAELGISSN